MLLLITIVVIVITIIVRLDNSGSYCCIFEARRYWARLRGLLFFPFSLLPSRFHHISFSPRTHRQPREMYRRGNAPRRGGRGKNLLGLRRLLRRGNSEIFPPPIGSGFATVGYGRKSRAADAFRKKSLAKSCMVAGKTVPLPASLGQIFFPPPLTPSFGFARGHPQGERGRGAVTESALKIFATL